MRAWYLPEIRKLSAWSSAVAAWGPLSRIRERILRAAIAAMRPRGFGFDQAIDEDVLENVEQSIAHLPARLRIRLWRGLCLMEYGPPVYLHRLLRLSGMTPAEGQCYVARWEHARGSRGEAFRRIRGLVFTSFYQHPEVLAANGIGWAQRAEKLVRLRAELLSSRSGETSDGH